MALSIDDYEYDYMDDIVRADSADSDYDSGSRPNSENTPKNVPSIIRDYFPETWLWDLHELNSSMLHIAATIPDTITQWDASAFCISPQDGIGIPPQQPITTFQPFFMDYTLPFSVKRGETLMLKVSVFNYLNKQLPVSIIIVILLVDAI